MKAKHDPERPLPQRRALLVAVAALAAAPPGSAFAQSQRIPVVGFLTLAGADSFAQFQTTMRELGYADGQNIRFERRSSAGAIEPLPALAGELVRLNVDVLYATGPAAVRAARDATRAIPIVAFDLETDPVASGLVETLNRPGGNLTGLFLDLPGIAGKWLELLREAAPHIRVIRVLWDSTSGSGQLTAAREAARRLGIPLDVLEIRGAADLDAALARAGRGGESGLVVLSSPIASDNSRRIAEATVRHRIPAISAFRAFAVGGGLLSYGPDLLAFRRFSAAYVDKILRGARPSELPIQQPALFEFVVNAKTARDLGLALPRSLLLRADQVIG